MDHYCGHNTCECKYRIVPNIRIIIIMCMLKTTGTIHINILSTDLHTKDDPCIIILEGPAENPQQVAFCVHQLCAG